MSDSVRPHRQQPTRLPHPWDSPGKNTGVSCRFLLQCMKVKSEVAQSCPTQRPQGLQPTRLLCPWDFPGKSTEFGRQCLLWNSMLGVVNIKEKQKRKYVEIFYLIYWITFGDFYLELLNYHIEMVQNTIRMSK